MRANRYLVAIVGAVLAVSFALPGAALAQEEKYNQAVQAYQAGNWSEAETLFRELCAEYEDAGTPWGGCHMLLGTVLANQGGSKRQEALAQLEIAKDLVTEDSEHYSTDILIANIHLAERRWEQAIAAADEAAQYAGPDQAAAIAKVKGQAHYQQEQWQQATTELETATQASGGDASLYAWLGRSYFELGDTDAALPALTQATQIDRNNRIGLYFAARIYFANDNFPQTITLAERAIQAHPQDTNIRNLLGMAYLGEGRTAEAAQQFEVVIGERPDDATAIYNLGQAYLQQEDWARAVEQFQTAQNLFPAGSATQGRLLYDLGIAFERLERYEDALQAFNDSRAINETTNVLDAIDRVQERIRRGKGGGGG